MLAGWVDRWPILAVRGACAVLLGILVLAWPGVALLTLATLLGAYVLVAGGLAGIMAFTRQPPQPRWLLGIEAVIGLGAGVMLLSRPGLTVASMIVVGGVWAVMAGVARLAQAFLLRRELTNEWMLGLSGALTLGLGLLLLARPGAGAVAIAWTLGLLAIAQGGAELAMAWRLRGLALHPPAGPRVWSMRTEQRREASRKDQKP